MSKRKLRMREIEIVVLDVDITSAGNLRKDYVAHIGRITREGGEVVALACGATGQVWWTYPSHWFLMVNLRLCKDCWFSLLDELYMRDRRLLAKKCNPRLLIGG